MRSSAITGVFVCSFLLCGVVPARGESFTILPGGDLVFNVALTSQGAFVCGAIADCIVSDPRVVTLGSGGNMTTLTFIGVDTTAQAGNVAVPITVGEVQAAATGTGFVFPANPNPNVPILRLDFSLSQTSPIAGTQTLSFFFGPGGGSVLPLLIGQSYFSFPTGPNPPGFNYTALVYSFSPFPFSIVSSGSTAITADVGAVPEPATLLLVGTGLASAVLGRRRRQKRRT